MDGESFNTGCGSIAYWVDAPDFVNAQIESFIADLHDSYQVRTSKTDNAKRAAIKRDRGGAFIRS